MRRATGILRWWILPILVLAFVLVSLGGAAHESKDGHIAGALSAVYPHSEPAREYGRQGGYEMACLSCHPPVGCLSADRCRECHATVEWKCPDDEGPHSVSGASDIRVSQVRGPEQGDACGTPFGAINHMHLSGFSLFWHRVGFDGAPLPCEGCHPDGAYDRVSVACIECHAEEAPVFMADHTAEHGDGCTDCHDGWTRQDSAEQGDLSASDSAHREAGCRECHTGSDLAEGVRECADCHEEPEIHGGRFGLHCDWCHSATAWSPATLTEHDFRLNHGGLDEVSCETCHSETYVAYTCYGCHDHQPAEMEALHAPEGIERLEPCGECHPTGLQGDAKEAGHGT